MKVNLIVEGLKKQIEQQENQILLLQTQNTRLKDDLFSSGTHSKIELNSDKLVL